MSAIQPELQEYAAAAMAQYAVGEAELGFLGHSENATFRVQVHDGGRYLLRIHRPVSGAADDVWQRPDVIESELLWLEALQGDADLAVPESVRNRRGNLLTEVGPGAGSEPLCGTLLRWVEGEPLAVDVRRTPAQAERLGAVLARLQQHAGRWQLPRGFTRPTYDWERLRAAMPELRAAVDAGVVSAADYAMLERAAHRIRPLLSSELPDRDGWGLIHADLHESNYVLYRGDVRPIDFSRCGFGYDLYDVAMTLQHLHAELRRDLLRAYGSIRPLPADHQRALEGFLVAAMIEGYGFHASNPEQHAWLARSVRYVADRHVRHYLDGEPFLFSV